MSEYSGGEAYVYDGSWSISGDAADMCFVINGETGPAPFTPPLGGPTKKRLIAVAHNRFWYEDI